MDPRDQLRALPDGMDCTVCDEPVPSGRVHLLAQRDDLAFVQVECTSCGSSTLEFVDASTAAVRARGSAAETTGEASGSTPPISRADVVAMREFLAEWRGDARGLIDPVRRKRGSRSSGPAE